MTDVTRLAERAARSQEAEQAMKKFLAPAFDCVIATYMERLTEIAAREPWSAQKMTNVAMAARIAAEVRSQIEAIVHDGEVAANGMQMTRKVEQMSLARRKWLGIGLAR